MSSNLSFNVLAMSAAWLWDLWYVFRSSTYGRSVIFSFTYWDRVHPSVLRTCHAIGYWQTVNSLTQNESACKIPCLKLNRSNVFLGDNCFNFQGNFPLFYCITDKLCDFCWYTMPFCWQKFNLFWFIESNAFFTSIHVHDRFFLINWALLALFCQSINYRCIPWILFYIQADRFACNFIVPDVSLVLHQSMVLLACMWCLRVLLACDLWL